jgi:hypothetical protein
MWPAGGFDGTGNCLNLKVNANTLVNIPPSALDFLSTKKAISMSIWIKMDYYAPTDSWARLIEIGATDVNSNVQEVLEFECPTARPPSFTWGPRVQCSWRSANDSTVGDGNSSDQMINSDFASQWNNYIIVKNNNGGADGNTLQVYHNGYKIIDANHLRAPLPTAPVARFLLGAMEDSEWQQHWVGYIDDFRVYDYALTAAQAAYIGTKGTGAYSHPMSDAATPANLYTADTPGQRINFKDYALMAKNWLQTAQWP